MLPKLLRRSMNPASKQILHKQCDHARPRSPYPGVDMLLAADMTDILLAGFEMEDWTPEEFMKAYRLDEPTQVVVADSWRAVWRNMGETLQCVMDKEMQGVDGRQSRMPIDA